MLTIVFAGLTRMDSGSCASDEVRRTRLSKDDAEEEAMAWFVLIASGVFEAVWATALGMSNGLTRLWPSVVFFVALAVSMAGLAYAMKTLPTGSSYAIWVGIGASIAVIYAMVTGAEPVSAIKIALVLGLIGCIVGLRLVS